MTSDSKVLRVGKEDVHVLYAGKLGDDTVVLIRQGDRVIPIEQRSDSDWNVGGVATGVDPVDGSPIDLNDRILLPTGDWTWLPLRHDPYSPRIVDGLIDGGAELKPGFAIQKGATNDLGRL